MIAFCVSPGLAGKTDLEQAKVDMIVDCIVDSRSPMIKWFQEKDEAKKVIGRKMKQFSRIQTFSFGPVHTGHRIPRHPVVVDTLERLQHASNIRDISLQIWAENSL